MVRVLSCHHFASQDVFSSAHTPVAMCTSKNYLFIATSHCYLEVHSLTEKGSPQKYRLPTVAPVIQVVHCRADDYIATIEKGSTRNDDNALRIYINWRADLSKYPMRVRVAGNMKSLKYTLEEGDSAKRLQVVEIPLKASPLCLAVDEHTGNLAVGIHRTILLYGLCCKKEANTNIVYEDFKCLLELQFSFIVNKVSICEEFLLAVSKREFQVVKLNLDQIPVTVSKKLSDDVEDLASRLEKQRCFKRKEKPPKKNTPCLPDKEPLFTRIRKNTFMRQQSTSPVSPSPYIVEDKHFFTLDVDDITSSSESAGDGAPGESNVIQRVWLDSIKKATEENSKRKRSTSINDEVELLGPTDNSDCCQKCWAVSVEYEDHCDCNVGPSGVLEQGVSTLIFRRLNFNTKNLHSPQLLPVYTRATSSCEGDGDCLDDDGWGTFTSSHRDHLVALHCYVSSDRQGFLYDVLSDQVKMLATYPYTGPVSQVCLEGSLLYALSPNGIEIYTTRCQARAAASIWPQDINELSASSILIKQEPCVIGLQPFIGLQTMSLSQSHLTLFSMQEDSWSIYVLEKPGIDMLHADIRELASAYKETSSAAFSQLSQEAYLLAWSNSCFETDNSTLRALLANSCLDMAPLCASGFVGKAEHAIELYLQSKCSIDELLSSPTDFSDYKIDRPSIMIYLEWIFDTAKGPIHASQESCDTVIDLFTKFAPLKLPAIILANFLPKYSSEFALNAVKSTMNGRTPRRMHVMALAALHLNNGDQGDAEALLLSLSKDDIVSVGALITPSIVEIPSTLTPLALLLRRRLPEVFISLMIHFKQNGVLHHDEIMQLLGGYEGSFSVMHLEAYLEGILLQSNSDPSGEIALQLCSFYLKQIQETPDDASHHNSSSSADLFINSPDSLAAYKTSFTTRFSWLDYLEPFKGPETVLNLQFKDISISQAFAQPNLKKISTPVPVSIGYLLKIQSLLCSNYLPQSFYQSIMDIVSEEYPSIQGHDSIVLLCQIRLDSKAAIDCVIEDHPKQVAAFLKDSFPSDMLEEWKYACVSVLQLTSQLSPESMPEMHATYSSALNDILESVCELLPPDQLIALLPRDSSIEFFSKFVKSSTRCHQLHQLKEAIVAQSVLLRAP